MFPQKSDFRLYINILRALAIFSVVCAHVSSSDKMLCNIIVGNLGTYGVGLFLFLSGYFFYKDKKNFSAFALSKGRNIVLPWMFCGTLDWFYVVLRKGGLSISSWCDSIFVHSHYYYLTVLLILFFSLYYFRNNFWVLFVAFVLSLVSCFFTGKGFLNFIYIYVNPLNWAVYLIAGIFVSKYNLLEQLVDYSRRSLPYTSLIAIYYFAWITWDGQFIKYWGNGNILFVLFMIFVCMGMAYYICRSSNIVKQAIVNVGTLSFTVYLIHMPFAGIVTKLVKVCGMESLIFISPSIVIIVVIALIYVILYLSRMCRIESFVKSLIGIRL